VGLCRRMAKGSPVLALHLVWQSEQNLDSWQRVQELGSSREAMAWVERKSAEWVVGIGSPRRERLLRASASRLPPMWQSRQYDCSWQSAQFGVDLAASSRWSRLRKLGPLW